VIHLLGAISLSFFPVVTFLALLFFMDTFKLLPRSAILRAIAAGALVAVMCYYVSAVILTHTDISQTSYRRYVAPLFEESLKALYIVFLIRTARVGFLVDAGISGFAVGTGFALVENLNYLLTISSPNLLLWVVRGFGTAIMHGSTAAVFGMLGLSLCERHPKAGPAAFLPGLLIGYCVHSLYNHFVLHPLVATALLLIVLPLLTVVVFERSERATRAWLGVGFDTDVELLDLVNGSGIGTSRVGHYLESLTHHFPGRVVGDLLCLLRVHLELSIRAKGILLAREAGVRLPPDPQVRANLEELDYLNKSVGRTGRLAIAPFLNMTRRELWQLYLLGSAGTRPPE
jgi:protease PrsW